MSLFDIWNDAEARYMLAYALACCVPWSLTIILYCRIKHGVK